MDYTRRPQIHRPAGRARLAVLGLVLLAAACARTAPEPPRPNVVLVLVDTLRADHLGTYGYARPTSPHLDALAAESFLFEQARAQAPCTFPSANSILTGRYPVRFLVQPEKRLGIPESIPSLAEILGGAGYATAAVSASPIVRKTATDQNPHGGFDRGFDRFDESCLWEDAKCVHRKAKALLDDLPEPFFLYLHYMDPHDPYRIPPDWPRRFVPAQEEGGGEVSPAAAAGDPNPIADAFYGEGDASLATLADLARLRDLYDEEIAYIDAWLGRLVVDLRRRGLLDRSILVVLSDHGEEFFEHRHVKHCQTVFDTEIRTPLLVRLPPELAAGNPRRIRAQAANLDVVPTLLDYLWIETADLGLEGTSLRPLLERDPAGPAPSPPPVFAAWGGLRAVQDGPFKLVYWLRNGDTRLYHLERDPGETRNAVRAHPRETRRLLRALSRWRAQVEGEQGGLAVDEAAVERLRALGYLQ